MPWSGGDASRHKKGLSSKSSRKWANIANSVLAKTGDEGRAVRAANSSTKVSQGAIKRRLMKGK